MGDFNIDGDIDIDSLFTMFMSLLVSIGFALSVNEVSHFFKHTLSLVLTFGNEIEHLIVFPWNPLVSDHHY